MAKGMFIMAWLIFLGLLSYSFSHWEANQVNPNQTVQSQHSVNGHIQVVINRNRAHHYVMNGKINQRPVVFLIDTGATDVVVPEKLAKRLGLEKGYSARARTANGAITVYGTKISSLSIGAINLQHVRAVINPAMHGDQILLGMSALKQLEFRQRGDQLTITQVAP